MRFRLFMIMAMGLTSSLAYATPLTTLQQKTGVIHSPSVSNPTGVLDPRVKIIKYDPLRVYTIHQHYFVSTDYQFGNDEIIKQVFLGDTSSWDKQIIDNHVSVKATKPNASGSMTVISNKYAYHFILMVSGAPIDSTEQVSLVKFEYPQEKLQAQKENQRLKALVTPPKNLCHDPLRYNLHYSFTGNQEQAPLDACDDGQFTYLRFRSSTDLPAIFAVDRTRHESVVNYRVEGHFVVVEKVAKELTLRNGDTVTNVYNDSAIGDWDRVRRNAA